MCFEFELEDEELSFLSYRYIYYSISRNISRNGNRNSCRDQVKEIDIVEVNHKLVEKIRVWT